MYRWRKNAHHMIAYNEEYTSVNPDLNTSQAEQGRELGAGILSAVLPLRSMKCAPHLNPEEKQMRSTLERPQSTSRHMGRMRSMVVSGFFKTACTTLSPSWESESKTLCIFLGIYSISSHKAGGQAKRQRVVQNMTNMRKAQEVKHRETALMVRNSTVSSLRTKQT